MGIGFDMSFGFNENNGSTSWIDAMRVSFFQGKATQNWIAHSTYQQAQPRHSEQKRKNQLTKVGIMHSHLLSLLKERIQHLVAKTSPTFWAFFGHRRQSSLFRIIGFLLFFDNNTLSHLNPDILNGRWCWVLQIYAIQQQRSPAFRHHHLTFLGFEQGSGWRIGWVSQDLKMLEGFDLKKKKKKSLLPWP